MLANFKVKGFKNFKNTIEFNLNQNKKYEFNKEAVKDGIDKTSIVYGINGSGKSNLGLAIFDIVLHLTDKQKQYDYYENYINLEQKDNIAEFYYRFIFDGNILEYQYQKSDFQTLLYEKVLINNNLVLEYDFKEKKGFCDLKGTENLNINIENLNISFVKYIMNNSILDENETNNTMNKFYDFVQRMLFFRSLRRNEYIGFQSTNENIEEIIINSNKLKDFETFLNNIKINLKLIAKKEGNKNVIYCKFGNKEVKFFDIVSTGTQAFTLFYAWLIRLKETKFVFIDEFDAFYHTELSKNIIKELLKLDTQIILTTHNTNIMTNDLLRPDCYFILENGNIESLANLTEKEIRKPHNLAKMYKAGAFND